MINDNEFRMKKFEKLLTKYLDGYYNQIVLRNDILFFQNKDKMRKNCFNISGLNIHNRLIANLTDKFK